MVEEVAGESRWTFWVVAWTPWSDSSRKGYETNMSKARGTTKQELERIGADPQKDDSEGSAIEDRWFGRGSHGWWDRLLKRMGKG